MVTINSRKTRRLIQKILYRLKRKHGQEVDYYGIVPGVDDVETGETTASTKTVIRLKRGITFDIKILNQFDYQGFGQSFKYGGQVEVGDKFLILDKRDLPRTFVPNNDDYIVFENRRYALKSWEVLDAGAGYFLHLRYTQGVQPNQILVETLKHAITVTQTIVSEVA